MRKRMDSMAWGYLNLIHPGGLDPMKYFFILLLAIGLFFSAPFLSAKSRITVSGDSIQVLDAEIRPEVTHDTTTINAPNLYRICVGGVEFFVVGSGKDAYAVQVMDTTGKPKACQ